MSVETLADLSILNKLYVNEGPVKGTRVVVPWYNPDQFLKVYQYLYSTNIMKKRWAVDQIEVWETRCHPSLPTAIEASLLLTKAIIHDILFTNEATICQEKEIQLMYSMALVRFVNLSIELHQSYSKHSLAEIAGKVGIPSWIVDLRHEASHSYTPSLPVLRLGAEEALKYLDDVYWSVESENLRSVVKECPDIEKFKALILAYEVTQYNIVYWKDKNTKKYRRNVKAMKDVLKKVHQSVLRNKKEFIEALCQRNVFIPDESDLLTILALEGRKNLEEPANQRKNIPPVLPWSLECHWYALLRIMHKYGAIPEFVESLLYSQGDRDAVGQKVLAAWVVKILNFSAQRPFKTKSPLLLLFKRRAPLFHWDRIFYALIANPCRYSPFMFPLIDMHLRLSVNFLRPLMHLMAIALGQAVDMEEEPYVAHPIFTVEDLKKSIKLQEKEKKKEQKIKETKSIWSLAPETIDWENIPIGHIFKATPDISFDFPENDWMDLVDNTVYTEKYLGNKNDIEDMEGINTVKKDTFQEDEKIISARKNFLCKTQSDS